MTWPDLYLICFIVGFTLSLISVMGGFFHLPGLHHAHGHHGHAHLGHVRAGGPQVSPFNLSTITAFLAWFGGIGYLLTKFSGIWLWLASRPGQTSVPRAELVASVRKMLAEIEHA